MFNIQLRWAGWSGHWSSGQLTSAASCPLPQLFPPQPFEGFGMFPDCNKLVSLGCLFSSSFPCQDSSRKSAPPMFYKRISLNCKNRVPWWRSRLSSQHYPCCGLAHCCGSGSIPGSGTSTWCGCDASPNDICGNMDGPRDYQTKWNNSEKDKYHILHVESKIWHKWTHLQNRNRLTDTENDLWLPRWEREQEGLGVWVNRCKLLHLECINNKVLLYSTGNYIQSPRIDHDGK